MSDYVLKVSRNSLLDRLRVLQSEMTEENRHSDAMTIDFVIQAMPTRYNVATDEKVAVTQEWVEFVQRQFFAFGAARIAAKRAIGVQDDIVVTTHPALQEFLDAWRPEFEQKPEQS